MSRNIIIAVFAVLFCLTIIGLAATVFYFVSNDNSACNRPRVMRPRPANRCLKTGESKSSKLAKLMKARLRLEGAKNEQNTRRHNRRQRKRRDGERRRQQKNQDRYNEEREMSQMLRDRKDQLEFERNLKDALEQQERTIMSEMQRKNNALLDLAEQKKWEKQMTKQLNNNSNNKGRTITIVNGEVQENNEGEEKKEKKEDEEKYSAVSDEIGTQMREFEGLMRNGATSIDIIRKRLGLEPIVSTVPRFYTSRVRRRLVGDLMNTHDIKKLYLPIEKKGIVFSLTQKKALAYIKRCAELWNQLLTLFAEYKNAIENMTDCSKAKNDSYWKAGLNSFFDEATVLVGSPNGTNRKLDEEVHITGAKSLKQLEEGFKVEHYFPKDGNKIQTCDEVKKHRKKLSYLNFVGAGNPTGKVKYTNSKDLDFPTGVADLKKNAQTMWKKGDRADAHFALFEEWIHFAQKSTVVGDKFQAAQKKAASIAPATAPSPHSHQPAEKTCCQKCYSKCKSFAAKYPTDTKFTAAMISGVAGSYLTFIGANPLANHDQADDTDIPDEDEKNVEYRYKTESFGAEPERKLEEADIELKTLETIDGERYVILIDEAKVDEAQVILDEEEITLEEHVEEITGACNADDCTQGNIFFTADDYAEENYTMVRCEEQAWVILAVGLIIICISIGLFVWGCCKWVDSTKDGAQYQLHQCTCWGCSDTRNRD